MTPPCISCGDRWQYCCCIGGPRAPVPVSWPLRFGLALLLAVLIIGLLAACAPPRAVLRPEVVEVPRYIRAPVPAQFTEPLRVWIPDGDCWHDGQRLLCNGQLAQLLIDYRAALDVCNVHRAAVRTVGEATP